MRLVVVAHHDCGMQSVEKDLFVKKLLDRGISAQTIEMMEYAGDRSEGMAAQIRQCVRQC